MSEKQHLFKPNTSGNPRGRPKGSTGRPISKLRKTLTKLREMEDKALDNIKTSIEGKEVDKETLASSKWVISSLASIAKAAIEEEKSRMQQAEVNDEKEVSESVDVETKSNVVTFTTQMVK